MTDDYLRGVTDALAAIHALGGVYVLEAIEKLGLPERSFEGSAFLAELQKRRGLAHQTRESFEAGMAEDYRTRRAT